VVGQRQRQVVDRRGTAVLEFQLDLADRHGALAGFQHAAIEGDLDLLKLAVLHDPLTGAICTPEEVWQMVDEMVVAQAAWLPQYADAIPGARERLASATVKTRDWSGAASKYAVPVWAA